MSTHRRPRQAARQSRSAKYRALNSPYRRTLRHEPLEDRRLLAVVTVTTLADTIDFNDGVTSLREAIFATNTVPGADTIDFAPALTSHGPVKILLTQGELKISDSLLINGPGRDLLTIDASGSDPTPLIKKGDGSRLLDIDDRKSTLIDTSIIGLTLTGADGDLGGAIYSTENIEVINCSVVNNYAALGGGIYIYLIGGNATISHTDIFNNSALQSGGGLEVSGSSFSTIQIDHVNASNNFAPLVGGGALIDALASTVTVTGSTFSQNSSNWNGGGIYAAVHQLGTITIQDSTITGNLGSAGVSLYATATDLGNPGKAILLQCTVTNNSGGGVFAQTNTASSKPGQIGQILIQQSTITDNNNVSGPVFIPAGGLTVYGSSSVVVEGSIIAGNRKGAADSDLFVNGFEAGLFKNSLIGSAVGTFYSEAPIGFPDAYGNIVGGPVHGVIDSRLGPLADNGGATLTRALLPGSPAIDAGSSSAIAGLNEIPSYDQRELPFTRVFNSRIDIGAFEFQPLTGPNLVVDTLSDESDGDYLPGHLSLREAIELSNLWPSFSTIEFDPALTANGPATILLAHGELTISDAVTISGPGPEMLSIDAGLSNGAHNRIFNVDDQSNNKIAVAIRGLRLTGGGGTSDGGAIFSSEALELTNDVIDQNTGMSAVVYSSGTFVIDHCHFFNNSVSNSIPDASVIAATTLTIRDSEISNNFSAAISVGANAEVSDTAVSGNSGFGLLFKSGASGQVLRSIISGNTSDRGGVAFFGTGNLLLSDSTIANNFGTSASHGGGGGYFNVGGSGSVTIERSSFTGNRAISGGAIWTNSSLQVLDSEFRGNAATTGSGGAIYILGQVPTTSTELIINSTFEENIAAISGGAVYLGLVHRRDAEFVADTFTGNSADVQGGAIAIQGMNGSATFSGSTIHSNHSVGGGGGFWISSGASQIRVENSTIDGNTAHTSGGGVLIGTSGANTVIVQTTVSGNTAGTSGGGVAITGNSGSTTISSCTITLNSALSAGGGLLYSVFSVLHLMNTIVAGNIQVGASPDFSSSTSNLDVSYSLIGNSTGSRLTPTFPGSPDQRGNIIGGTVAGSFINAKLAPLANNGGPTMTHALLPGSPAINAGDPSAVAGVNGVPYNDQRGAPYTRVYGGRIDIGAFELQPTDAVPGDFNRDGGVDMADYVMWRRQLGSSVPAGTGADGNGDGVVGDADYALWRADFGLMKQLHVAAASGSVQASAVADSSVGDTGLHAVPAAKFALRDEGAGVGKKLFRAMRDTKPTMAARTLELALAALPTCDTREQGARNVGIDEKKLQVVEDEGSMQISIDDAFAALETRVAGKMIGRRK